MILIFPGSDQETMFFGLKDDLSTQYKFHMHFFMADNMIFLMGKKPLKSLVSEPRVLLTSPKTSYVPPAQVLFLVRTEPS